MRRSISRRPSSARTKKLSCDSATSCAWWRRAPSMSERSSDHAISEFAQYVDDVLAFCDAEDVEPPAPREAA